MSLEAMLRAARDDEPGSWTRLTLPLQSRLQRYFSQRLDTEDARELAQLTIVTIYEQLPGFEPKKSLEGWVFGIARNLLRREFRTQRRRADLHEAAGPILAAPRTGLSSQASRAELGKIVLEEVEELPDHLRSVIEHDLAEGDPATYAEAHGITATTVRTRRRRAHAQLEKRVEERIESPSPETSTSSPQRG